MGRKNIFKNLVKIVLENPLEEKNVGAVRTEINK